MSAEFLVICGLSGAGGSRAASDLEDLGWFVIDNVPAALIPKVGELAAAPGSTFERVALVVRIGAAGVGEIRVAIEHLRASARDVRIVYLDAATDVLIRRYEDTRRRHPFAVDGGTLAQAIERERALVEPLKADADVVVDTSELNVHRLSDRMRDLFGTGDPAELRINVVSFGYKHGLPLDVDLVLDCRFLPNPHWVDELRPLTGLDAPVRDYVLGQPEAATFLEHLDALLAATVPAYVREGRTYLSIALGCTGGRHRSVVMAGAVAELLRGHGHDPAVTHRDVDR
jgi:RNase adapter protein RapZ